MTTKTTGRAGWHQAALENTLQGHRSESIPFPQANIDALLSRLDGVKKTGTARWMARCPAHGDKTASLSIRDDAGKILLHCFGGCSVHEVTASIGMELSDLFPPKPLDPQQVGKPLRQPFNAADILQAVADDVLFVHLCAKAIERGETLIVSDMEFLRQAVARLGDALPLAGIKPPTFKPAAAFFEGGAA